MAKVSASPFMPALGKTGTLKAALLCLWCLCSLIERFHGVLARKIREVRNEA